MNMKIVSRPKMVGTTNTKLYSISLSTPISVTFRSRYDDIVIRVISTKWMFQRKRCVTDVSDVTYTANTYATHYSTQHTMPSNCSVLWETYLTISFSSILFSYISSPSHFSLYLARKQRHQIKCFDSLRFEHLENCVKPISVYIWLFIFHRVYFVVAQPLNIGFVFLVLWLTLLNNE